MTLPRARARARVARLKFDRRPRKKRMHPRCQLKRRFVSEVEARASGMISLEERRDVPKLWCYECPHCDGWHLTSKPHAVRWEITLPPRRLGAELPE